jgi:hypothetical protein
VNRDDIVRVAREAGLCDEDGRDSDSIVITDYLERFANLVAAAEREECAQTAEAVVPRHTECGNKIAKAIRERGAP